MYFVCDLRAHAVQLSKLVIILELVILKISDLMSGFGEDFKAFRIIVWHSINLIDGRIRFIPYLEVVKMKELKFALIGKSSHCLTYLEITLSKFSITQVLLRSAMVKYQASFDSTKRC